MTSWWSPDGLDHPRTWNVTGDRDVDLLEALARVLAGQLCIGTTRVGVAGMSVGAFIAYHLACSGVPWITALAPVSGALPQGLATCHSAASLPLIAFNTVAMPGRVGCPCRGLVCRIWGRALR